MQHTIRHGGSIAAYTAHDTCPQAQTNVSRAEVTEASDASEKLRLQMQNKRQAGGKPCENQNNLFLRIF